MSIGLFFVLVALVLALVSFFVAPRRIELVTGAVIALAVALLFGVVAVIH